MAARAPLVVLLLATSACSAGSPVPLAGDAGGLDAGTPGPGPRDASAPSSARDGATLPRCEETEPPGTRDLAPVSSTLVATVTASLAPLAVPGARNPATERGEAEYAAMGLGVVTVGPPRERVRVATLGGGAPPASGRRSIAWFVHVSDFQLVDDESPVRLAALDNAAAGGTLRAQEGLVTRAVAAMNRTLARIEAPDRPYDFGIVTGDCVDDAQSNELDWLLAAMRGARALETDSGDDDDPAPGPDNDPKDPFDATAFPAPWLYVPGNHDVSIVGTTVPSDVERARAVGAYASLGTRDYRAWWAPVVRGPVPADPRRALVDREEIVARLVADDAASPGPPGHGYAGSVGAPYGASYAYDVIPGLLRVVALDTTDDTGGSAGLVRRALLDGFLEPALARAEADGVLVVVASHHAPSSIDTAAQDFGPRVADAVEPDEVERTLASHANVVAWLVGHEHDHRIRPVPGPDAAHPGFWEIMTTAIADWPSQARLLELVDNGDGTLSLFGTVVDFDTQSCLERRFRRLAAMEWQSGWRPDVSHRAEDQNVELVWPVPAGLAATVARAPGHERLESETTLRVP